MAAGLRPHDSAIQLVLQSVLSVLQKERWAQLLVRWVLQWDFAGTMLFSSELTKAVWFGQAKTGLPVAA